MQLTKSNLMQKIIMNQEFPIFNQKMILLLMNWKKYSHHLDAFKVNMANVFWDFTCLKGDVWI